jgi:hypothetical protein
MNKSKQYGFIATAVIIAIATIGLSQPPTQNVQAQTATEYCTNDIQDGVVVGFTCFPTKEKCKDFRNAIKDDSREQGIRASPCQPQ